MAEAKVSFRPDDRFLMRQFVYASAATQPFSTAALHTLLHKARARNSLYGVSGMLLYNSGSFLQVLEGEESYLQIIRDSIWRDARHTDTKILSNQIIERREFEAWSMGFIDISRIAPPEGLVNYSRSSPLLSFDNSQARKCLDFFRQGLYRQTIPGSATF